MSTSRYDLITNNKQRLSNGKMVYKTILYPEIQSSPNDIYIFSKEGDRLDLLAAKYYGDATQWWIIAHANKIKGTFILPQDMQLVIPMDIATINNDLITINS